MILNHSEARCPYFNSRSDACQASFSTMPIASKRIFTCCHSEDYDLCGIFLAKALRATHPGGFGRQVRELAFK